MSDPSTRTVSLNEIAQKYTEAIQHLSDLSVFLWASARSVSEQGYDDTARNIPGLPVTAFRLPFETAKEFAERAFFKHSINEVLGLVGVFLEDIRRLAGLIIFNAARARGNEDLATLAAQLNTPPPADLVARMKAVSERLQRPLPLGVELLSMVELARIHFQQNGSVAAGHAYDLKLKAIQPPPEGQTQPLIGDYTRTWNSEERVLLEREEHAAIFTTATIFFNTTLEALQEFAKVSGLTPEPDPSSVPANS